jgi:hypothetical protein
VEWRVARCPCEKKGGMGEKGGRRRLLNNVAEGGMEKGGGPISCAPRGRRDGEGSPARPTGGYRSADNGSALALPDR